MYEARNLLLPGAWSVNMRSVLLLVATLVLMTVQLAKANGGQLPQHAPKSLPPGVLGLDGWPIGSLWLRIACGCSSSLGRRLSFAAKPGTCRHEPVLGADGFCAYLLS
jgi:hypothetical protein